MSISTSLRLNFPEFLRTTCMTQSDAVRRSMGLDTEVAHQNAPPSQPVYDWSWFPKGASNLASFPAMILLSAYVGFGGLARDSGISLAELAFMIPTIWALPSHLVLASGIAANAHVLPTAAAVALASIRMMPMTMALVPEIRTPRSRLWHLLLISNMVAITAWIHTLQKAPDIPREGRLPYFAGFAMTMSVMTTLIASLVHQVAGQFPIAIMAALYFLAPLYFSTSMWNTARVLAEKYALFLGFVLGPVVYQVLPDGNILVAGLIGGSLAYALHRFVLRKPRGQG